MTDYWKSFPVSCAENTQSRIKAISDFSSKTPKIRLLCTVKAQQALWIYFSLHSPAPISLCLNVRTYMVKNCTHLLLREKTLQSGPEQNWLKERISPTKIPQPQKERMLLTARRRLTINTNTFTGYNTGQWKHSARIKRRRSSFLGRYFSIVRLT